MTRKFTNVKKYKERAYGSLGIVYEYYNMTKHKLIACYKYPFYKRAIDYLASIALLELQRREFDKIVPAFEDMRPNDFFILCRLEQIGQLDILIQLVKIAAKEYVPNE
jgi:hypothetical protein